MSAQLHIADGFALDLDAITKTRGILAQRRKGKTYTASVVAEEMAEAGQPWAVLDPTGAWWGMRASADGKKEGLPVLVIGGEHGQLPLERTAGKVMADLVVDEPGWTVFDVSLLESKAAERQFATDFAERLYRRKARSRSPFHVFVDEADTFVPQRAPADAARMLGAFEALVRRGGIRGIGTTLISQRAAVVNKNVLEQLDELVILRTLGPNDQKAIRAYVESYGTTEQVQALMASLATLDLGEAWIWEPGAEIFERVRIRERRTFNSSATPKAGERAIEPVKLADVDLDALRDKIAATVEKAKAEDPEELHKRIAELERELATRPDVEPERIPVPVIHPEQVDDLRGLMDSIRVDLDAALAPVADALRQIDPSRASLSRSDGLASAGGEGSPTSRAGGGERRAAASERGGGAAASSSPPPTPDSAAKLGRAARAILSVLVERSPVELTRSQVSTLSGYKPKSSTFANALSELRTKGLMEGSATLRATRAGIDAFGGAKPLPRTPEEVRAQWLGVLPQAPRTILEYLVDINPHAATRGEVAEHTGYSTTSSTFANALSTLRTNGLLIDGPDKAVGASEDLF